MRPIDCHEPAERVLLTLAIQWHERTGSKEPGIVSYVELLLIAALPFVAGEVLALILFAIIRYMETHKK